MPYIMDNFVHEHEHDIFNGNARGKYAVPSNSPRLIHTFALVHIESRIEIVSTPIAVSVTKNGHVFILFTLMLKVTNLC